ncbi:MAG TPA: acyltransferase [Stellaceae bacterium]|nr:acyltransferase [Stellaceae bacterium]
MTLVAPGVVAMPSKKSEILPLTGIRGVAAMWVVIFHLFGTLAARVWLNVPEPGIVTNIVLGGSTFAVDTFFILSGYIMAETYGRQSRTMTFLLHRAARVLPLHFVVLGALAAGVGLLEYFEIYPEDESFFSWDALPYHVVLVNVWFGLQGWNGPTWSLNSEFAAYLTFPVLQVIRRRFGEAELFGLALLFVIFDFSMLATDGFKAVGLAAIGRGLFGFGAGAMLRYSTNRRPLPHWLPVVCVAVIVFIACVNAYEFAIFPTAALIVSLGGTREGVVHNVLSARIFVWLGRISYSVYLVHTPILLAASQVLRRLIVLHELHIGVLTSVVLYLLILLAMAEMTWRYVEMPARRAIRRAWEAHDC